MKLIIRCVIRSKENNQRKIKILTRVHQTMSENIVMKIEIFFTMIFKCLTPIIETIKNKIEKEILENTENFWIKLIKEK
jgi:hypothetical protein